MATKFGPGLVKATKDAIYTVNNWVHWSGVIIGGGLLVRFGGRLVGQPPF